MTFAPVGWPLLWIVYYFDITKSRNSYRGRDAELSVRASVTSMARRSLSRSDPAIARAHELGLLQDLLKSFHYGARQVPGVSDEDSSGPGNSRALEEVSLTKYRNSVVRYSCDTEGKVTSPAPEVRQHRPLRRTRSWEYVYIPSLPYFHEVSRRLVYVTSIMSGTVQTTFTE